ncbi:oxidoreductase [Cladophialophora psammophila CBS 110553]|uniref:Oxidoreductase n=1 Tax=Cladophialophora psammophila CBS 110553 TaxID=1182543 RepID=W9VKP1_9EURO|nr:oxidoreductase [Cladophialophora psammophila CBS 110553]EXJ56252.1 oxidoreductase [Cladophialophora psammophila CBS 110553]
MSVEGRVFAVTGGGSGMGAAICRLLAERGARAVCAADISPTGFAALKESVAKVNPSTEVHCTPLDVAKSTAVDEWIQSIIKTFGDLHGAANVAGLPQAIGMRKAPNILEETDKMWSRIMGVNLSDVFYCTRAEISVMKDLSPGDRAIVNISSMAPLKHDPDIYAYRTSKAACAHFSQSVAKDTHPFGIRVNCVSPASTQTPMMKEFVGGNLAQLEDWKTRGWQMLDPEDVARIVVWLLSEDSKSVFGVKINVGAALP